MKTALETTGISTFAGALSTSLCLLLLIFAEFQGLAQFGVVAALGVFLAFLGAAWVLPLLLRRLGEGPGIAKGKRTDTSTEGAAAPWPFGVSLVLSIAGLGLLGASLIQLPDLGFEYDLRNLDGRKTKSQASSSDGSKKKVSWRDALPSGATTAVMVATTDSAEQTKEIHRQLAAYLKKPYEAPTEDVVASEPLSEDEDDPFAGGGRDRLAKIRALASEVDSLDEYPGMSEWYDESTREVMRDRIRRVFSVFSFVPEYQKEKLKIIAAIRKEVKRKKGQVGDETA